VVSLPGLENKGYVGWKYLALFKHLTSVVCGVDRHRVGELGLVRTAVDRIGIVTAADRTVRNTRGRGPDDSAVGFEESAKSAVVGDQFPPNAKIIMTSVAIRYHRIVELDD
jgi:hypothetical protein